MTAITATGDPQRGGMGAWICDRLTPLLDHPALRLGARLVVGSHSIGGLVAGSRTLDDLPPGARILNRDDPIALRQRLGRVGDPGSAAAPRSARAALLAFARIPTTMAAHGPSTYIRLLRDGTISPAQQTLLAGRLGNARVVSIEGDHMVMLSRPRELADALNEVERIVRLFRIY